MKELTIKLTAVIGAIIIILLMYLHPISIISSNRNSEPLKRYLVCYSGGKCIYNIDYTEANIYIHNTYVIIKFNDGHGFSWYGDFGISDTPIEVGSNGSISLMGG